jgi:8-oxo-dGTP diphosphatase
VIRDEEDVIMAAGAVVWRRNPEGKIEVAVIHRPAYDDWTLPKGKVEGSETLIACAFREIEEETGLKTRFGPYLGDTFYEVNGVPKVVRYWSAQVIAGDDQSFDRSEVDELLWLPPKKTLEKLTIKDDRQIVKSFLKVKRDTTPLILLRHARALDRKEWSGDDGDRPLTEDGHRQVRKLMETLPPFGLTIIHTSDAIRCLDTARPIAQTLGVELVVSAKLSEYEYHRDKTSAEKYIKQLFQLDQAVLICGHNPMLTKIIKKMARRLDMYNGDFSLGKGDAFILHRSNGKIRSIDHLKAN